MAEVDNETFMPADYVWVRAIHHVEPIELDVAMFIPFIRQEVNAGVESSKSDPITLPWRVTPSGLSMVLEYCRFHIVPDRTNKDRKSFDDRYYQMDPKIICEVSSAASSLQLQPLADLTSQTLTKVIEEKIFKKRGVVGAADEFSEEEKLEPIRNTVDDPRIRLLNRLHARKQKEIKEKESSKSAEVEEEQSDQRSVDDLLSFINGDNHDTKVLQPSKSKKKNRKRKDHNKVSPTCASTGSSSVNAADEGRKDSRCFDSILDEGSVAGNFSGNDGKATKLQDMYDDLLVAEDEFDDLDPDDGIDPALKEAIDREVEDFARRLNADWSERLKEISSPGQERKPLHLTVNDNASLRRLTT